MGLNDLIKVKITFRMTGKDDSEREWVVDRIKYIAFREARDAGASFINRKWIAANLNQPPQ